MGVIATLSLGLSLWVTLFGLVSGMGLEVQAGDQESLSVKLEAQVSTPDTDWTKVLARGRYGSVDLGEFAVNNLFGFQQFKVFRRVCLSCRGPHKEIFYHRKRRLGWFNMYLAITGHWEVWRYNNNLFRDFDLYSSWDDLKHRRNKWRWCDRSGWSGFPGDCGPRRRARHQWSAKYSPRGRGKYHIAYYIYTPKCPPGTAKHGGIGCVDVNECKFNNGGCDGRTSCTNKFGTRRCGKCPSKKARLSNGQKIWTGFFGSGAQPCEDINECDYWNGGCDRKGKCHNTEGGFQCRGCVEGYKGTGRKGQCSDINECARNNGGCHHLATCTNTKGSYHCGDCPKGYTGTGYTHCRDINECAWMNGGCDPLTACINTPGGRTCGKCPKGYRGDGTTGCKDINECSKETHSCPAAAPCVNTRGSYTCDACPRGYWREGHVCADINECERQNGGCDPLVTCENYAGGRKCGPCPDGYRGDGIKGCVKIDPNSVYTDDQLAAMVTEDYAQKQLERMNAANKEYSARKIAKMEESEKFARLASLQEQLKDVEAAAAKQKAKADAEKQKKLRWIEKQNQDALEAGKKYAILAHAEQNVTQKAFTPGENDDEWPVNYTRPAAAETEEKPTSKNYYKMEMGACCCPPSQRIQTQEECGKALDELGMRHDSPWSGERSAMPADCSWRESDKDNMHWNTATSGKAKEDLTPICRSEAMAKKEEAKVVVSDDDDGHRDIDSLW